MTQGSCLSALEVNMLYACNDDDNCLSPLGYTPQIQVITPLRTDIKGDEISINTNDFRSTTYNYMFNQFFSNVPKYAALGIFRLQISTNFRYFSAKIDSIQSQSIKYTVTIGPSSYVLGLGVALMASDFGMNFD